MSRRVRVAGAVLLVAAVLGGCGAPGPAQPDPFPPRPENLAVTGLRACDALGVPPPVALGILDRTPDVLNQGANNCVFKAAGGQFWVIRIQPGIQARRYVPGDRDFLGDDVGLVGQRVTTVDGFGAVENVNALPATNYTCSVVVDADPDASFTVGYEVNSQQARSRTVGSREQGCAQASRVASLVIATARARD